MEFSPEKYFLVVYDFEKIPMQKCKALCYPLLFANHLLKVHREKKRVFSVSMFACAESPKISHRACLTAESRIISLSPQRFRISLQSHQGQYITTNTS